MAHILAAVALPRKQFRAYLCAADWRHVAKMSAQRNRRPTTGSAGVFVDVKDGDTGAICWNLGRGRRFFTPVASCPIKYSAT